MNYRNVFDPETRLMRGRLKDGKFQSPFNPFKWGMPSPKAIAGTGRGAYSTTPKD